MTYQCEVREQPIQPALSIRSRISVQDLPREIGRALKAITTHLTNLGEKPAGASFVAYYNMDMQDLDVEIGFPISKQLMGKGEIQSSELPGKVATCLFVGPYNEIRPAYDALTEWTEQQGYEPTGIAYEIYFDDPSQTPPEELKTQIMFPLKS